VCHQLGQVCGSSGRPDPLVGDGREPGQWGSRGTHVSQNRIEKKGTKLNSDVSTLLPRFNLNTDTDTDIHIYLLADTDIG
jgi:hypothetical protein